jgi:hypothetical protein
VHWLPGDFTLSQPASFKRHNLPSGCASSLYNRGDSPLNPQTLFEEGGRV